MKKWFEAFLSADRQALPHFVFGFEGLPSSTQGSLLSRIAGLQAPRKGGDFEILESHSSGNCALFILRATWFEYASPGGCWPFLLIRRQDGWKLLGVMMPFHELEPELTFSEQADASDLTSWWIPKSQELMDRFGAPPAFKDRMKRQAVRQQPMEDPTDPSEWEVPDSPDDILGYR